MKELVDADGSIMVQQWAPTLKHNKMMLCTFQMQYELRKSKEMCSMHGFRTNTLKCIAHCLCGHYNHGTTMCNGWIDSKVTETTRIIKGDTSE